MGRCRSLKLDQRNRVQGMLETEMYVTAVAHQIGVQHSTVSQLWSRWEATGSLQDRQRSGRPRVLTAAQDQYIVLMSRKNGFIAAKKIASQHHVATRTRASDKTIRRRVHTRTLCARKPYIFVPLSSDSAKLDNNSLALDPKAVE